jgi:hypothetical protein
MGTAASLPARLSVSYISRWTQRSHLCPFPRRKGRNWVFALSPWERAKFLTSAPCVRPKTWVKTSAWGGAGVGGGKVTK